MLENVVVGVGHGKVGRDMFSLDASLFGRRVKVSEGDESTVCGSKKRYERSESWASELDVSRRRKKGTNEYPSRS